MIIEIMLGVIIVELAVGFLFVFKVLRVGVWGLLIRILRAVSGEIKMLEKVSKRLK